MRYKWKPSKTQKREFAERMATDTAYSEAYHQRKEQRAETRRSTSKFDYQTAGGEYIPTGSQNKAAFELLNLNPTPEQPIKVSFKEVERKNSDKDFLIDLLQQVRNIEKQILEQLKY